MLSQVARDNEEPQVQSIISRKLNICFDKLRYIWKSRLSK